MLTPLITNMIMASNLAYSSVHKGQGCFFVCAQGVITVLLTLKSYHAAAMIIGWLGQAGQVLGLRGEEVQGNLYVILITLHGM